MNQTRIHHIARTIAPVASSAFLFGCVVDPTPLAPATTSSAVTTLNPSQCEERPACAFSPAPTTVLTTLTPADRAVLDALSCGPIYSYTSGANQGFLRGIGSFCADSTANRHLLHDNLKAGFHPGYCQSCLGVPAGKLFVFWTVESSEGPNCPSTCREAPGPDMF
jgi:hypothetical protein